MGQEPAVDSSAPAAGSGVEPSPSMAAAGSGGVADSQAGAAGSAGAGSDNLRQRFIDAAIDALGGSDGMEPWRTGGQTGGRLSADLVLGVLVSMRTSGVCFRDVRRCVETCVMISQDCKPCAEDAECAAALKEVCGETLGTCRTP